MHFFPIYHFEMKSFGYALRNLRKNISHCSQQHTTRCQEPLAPAGAALPLGHLKVIYSVVSAFIFLIKVSWFYGTLNLLKHLYFCKQKSTHLNSLETSENTHLKYLQLCHHQTFEITLPVPANHLEIFHNSLKICMHAREILLEYFTACSWSNPGIFTYLPHSPY